MSWGTELWDQFDNIAIHTQKGLDFCERYGHFVKERCAIEQEYAQKLKKLVKNYQPKKKGEDDCQLTAYNGFSNMVKEVHDMAGQHEVISENLSSSILKELTQLLQDLKQERKKHLQDGAKQMNHLQAQLAQLERSKKQYEKAFKESEKAAEAHKKADADINLSRAEVEKAKNISLNKQQHCEDCKNEYAAELQKSNSTQREHYTSLMPKIFQQLQDMDERRIARFQDFIRQGAASERSVIPIVNTCIDGMVKAADSISASEDSKIVIDKYKSGFQPPGDIPFEDLSTHTSSESLHRHPNTPKQSLRGDNNKGTFSGNKGKKRGGIFGIFSSSKTDETKEDYSHLPPTQQKKKLNQKIDNLKNVVAKETNEREGMLKMRDVYVKNPALGDPSSLDKQLEENAQKLDKLRQELHKYETYLQQSDNRNGNAASLDTQSHQSHSDESLTHSISDASVASKQESPATPAAHLQLNQNDSPDSTMDNANRSGTYNDEDSFDDGLDDYGAIGTCKAMYTFEAASEGSIDMTEGEEFSIVEQDQGDGWTRVRRSDGVEGFVPTSYVECTFD